MPAASTAIPPLFDGRQIVPQGSVNFSQLNADAVNKQMDRIAAPANIADANKAWGDLDEKIMTDYAPIFPLLNDKAIFDIGSGVKGVFLHGFYGEPDMGVNLGIG